MPRLESFLLFAALTAATITIEDPSDVIDTAVWAADNALIADYKSASNNLYQWIPVVGANVYNGEDGTISHETLSAEGNDTSVLVVANSSEVTIDYSTIIKHGYTSDLNQASFYGINAAINVANNSVLRASNINITTHNGAANLYAYGTGSVAYVDNSWLYSSGPVSHGLYAGGNGTVYGNNIHAYSGGTRCSIFSGDNPAGYIHISDAIVHTDGIGSAICYALGLCNMTNVVGVATRSPAMFSDGIQTGIWTNSDITAGLLGGIVMFSSQRLLSGASVTLDNTRLTVTGPTVPAFWFGNIVATATLTAATINNTASNLLAVANYSQITQDFDLYASYADNPALSPATATIDVAESSIAGDLVAYNGSALSLNLTSYSAWTGTAYSGFGDAYFSVALDASSNWTLTADTVLTNFSSADAGLANVLSNGYTLTYAGDAVSASSSSANSTTKKNKRRATRLGAWKRGTVMDLQGGGKFVVL